MAPIKDLIHKNVLFVVSGPSGSGKGTFIDHAIEHFKTVKHIPTYTTRSPRPKEIPGKDYNYVTAKEFQLLIDTGGIFEYTKTYKDFMYGSPRSLIRDEYDLNLVVELDYKGMFRVKSASDHRVVSVFIMPPDMNTLIERINKRSKEKNLKNRLSVISEQMQFAWAYDYVIVNDEWDNYLKDIHAIVKAELIRSNGVKALLDNKHSIDHTLQ